jgi:hypothetical protein
MPSQIVTSDQYDIILSGGYRASEYLVVCPSDVVFAARLNATPPLDVISYITYDTVTVGALEDIKEGMTILVSHTDNTREAFFRGRIRKPPIDGVIYVNETGDAIVDNDYIFVLNTYDIVEKLRQPSYVDWDIPFRKIPPMVKDMQAAYCELTTAATATFTFEPTGQALTKSATIASYAWDIPDATYTVGSASTQDITIEVDTPYNDWGRLEVTDSNGVTNWFAFTITAGDPNTDTDIFRLCHDPVDYSADLDNGYTASVDYWDGVDDLLDITRVAIVVDEAYNDGDAELPNIRFVGYMMEDNGNVRGDETHGQLQNATINLSGFLQVAGEIVFYPTAITHTFTPTAWGQINTPTPTRIAAHVILEHSTLGNLAPIDWGVIDDTYFTGDADVLSTSLMDAATETAKKINASFTQDGGGQLVFRRNANFLTTAERDALDTVTPDPITLGEGMSFSLRHVHKRSTSAVNVGFSVYSLLTFEHIQITARAPANGAGQGAKQDEISGQILAPTGDIQDALDEAEERTGNWLEYLNPADMLTVDIDDGFGFISPSNDQWYKFDIPAANLPRGVAISTSTRWLCISIAPKLNDRGGRDIQAVFRRETVGGNANIFVAVVPAQTDTELSVLPPLPSYGGAWSPSPSINYETTDPEDLQPFDADDMSQTSPLPAEQGATQAGGMPPPGCARAYTTFKYDTNITMGFVTVLNDPYTLTIEGSARIEVGGELEISALLDLPGNDTGIDVQEDDEIAIEADGEWCYGVFTPEECNDADGDPTNDGGNQPEPHTGAPLENDYLGLLVARVGTTGDWTAIGVSGSFTAPTGGRLYLIINDKTGFYGDNEGSLTVTIGTPGNATYADAFYQWNLDQDGNPINVSLRTGLLIDNAAIAVVPPFDPSHSYTISLGDFNGGTGGTGNAIQFRFDDTEYADNENKPFTLTACGAEAGS